MTEQTHPSSPKAVLQNIFGYANFKGDQEVVINQLLAGKDCLVVMPSSDAS